LLVCSFFIILASAFDDAKSQPVSKPTPALLAASPFINQGKSILLDKSLENRISKAEKLFKRAFKLSPDTAMEVGDYYQYLDRNLAKAIVWYHRGLPHNSKRNASKLGWSMIHYGRNLGDSDPNNRTKQIYYAAWILAGFNYIEKIEVSLKRATKKLTADKYLLALSISDMITKNPHSALQKF